MFKLFTAIAATVMFAAFGTALIAESYFNGNSPALTKASDWEARERIISDVIDSDLPLLEGAAAFRDLNRQSPVLSEILVTTWPGDTEGERACQQVLAWVRAELDGRARASKGQEPSAGSVDPASTVLARLQAELAAAKGKDGNVRLLGDAK
jgi:hypothetical protein